ncbi:MAG: hypothetical protein H6708_31585 [Kofleriaceae bacterium]|nr:hypothetical protein [Myxococcales bacterium]MCB9564950.1 hypothetical protein [Kofleriaceae bacterium]
MDDLIWPRTKRDLLRRHPMGRDLGPEVRLVLLVGPVRVALRVRPLTGARVEVLAEVARLDSFAPQDALRWNAELDAGALAILDDVYVVRCVVDEVDDARVEARLVAAARGAALIKRVTHQVVDPACCGVAFANYAE